MNSGDDVRHKPVQAASEYCRQYARGLVKALEGLDWHSLEAVMECFWEARKHGATIFFVGNGGSAATASHFANDLAKATRVQGRRGFRALSLTDNLPLITALANDDGYDAVFTGQMQELFRHGDVLVAISVSGNSPNVIAAAKLAKQLGGRTVGLLGSGGGALRERCDLAVQVQGARGRVGPVEDAHLALDHMMTSYLRHRIAEEGAG